MAATIHVERIEGDEFRVSVKELNSATSHRVTLRAEDHRRLADGKAEPEELLRLSFEFLLEREPKESILSRFELPVIARYFPEYEREIKRRL